MPTESGLVLMKSGTAIQLKSTGEFINVTETTLEMYLATQFNIIHLPQNVYQQMYDAAPKYASDLEASKERGQAILLGFFKSYYPDYSISSFLDLSNAEAKAIHPKLGWGLWIQLLPKKSKDLPPPFDMHDFKQICYGRGITSGNE